MKRTHIGFSRVCVRRSARPNTTHSIHVVCSFSVIKSLRHLSPGISDLILSSLSCDIGFAEPSPEWISEDVRKRTNIKIRVGRNKTKDLKAKIHSKW